MASQDAVTRVRVYYAKSDSLRFIGHLDLQRLWERLLRRTTLPVRYSQGYHPRARLNLASALPLGFVSEAELLDFWMNEPRPVVEIHAQLRAAALPGLDIQKVDLVSLQEDALQTQMTASEFEVAFFAPQEEMALREKVEKILSQTEIVRTRRKKTYDLRPLILEMAVKSLPDEKAGLRMRLKASPRATGRPDEVLDALGYPNTDYLVKRTALILNQPGLD